MYDACTGLQSDGGWKLPNIFNGSELMDFHSLQSAACVIKEDWPAGGFHGA